MGKPMKRSFYRFICVAGLGLFVLGLNVFTGGIQNPERSQRALFDRRSSEYKKLRPSLGRHLLNYGMFGVLPWDDDPLDGALMDDNDDNETKIFPQCEAYPWIEEGNECRGVHDYNTSDSKCCYVRLTDDCLNDEGFFDYSYFVYCLVGNVGGAMVVLVLWWLFCFVGLAVTADDFFCPALVVISTTLRLSPNVAGVTFLAFGNGAPDLFSAIAALGNLGDGGDSGLAVGGLFGAGIFVTSVVVGTIATLRPFKAMERPFLRDVIFYLGGVYWTFFVLYKGYMLRAEAIGFIVAWLFYVVVVIISGSIYKRVQQNTKNPDGSETSTIDTSGARYIPTDNFGDYNMKQSQSDFSIAEKLDTIDGKQDGVDGKDNPAYNKEEEANGDVVANGTQNPARRLSEDIAAQGINKNVLEQLDALPDDEEDDDGPKTPMEAFLKGLNPINTDEWSDMGIIGKIYEVFKCPIVFLITITCPVVQYDDERLHNWNRWLQILQCVVSLPIVVLLMQFGLNMIGGVLPLAVLMLIIGIILGIVVFFTSENFVKPKYHWVFGYAGFLLAIVWIYVIANEIVSLLETFGTVFNISNAILGLTLLAWGNSIGDWIANSLMARQGFARMGFAACFGAPFFNLMLGFSIPLLVQMIQSGSDRLEMSMSGVQLILSVFLMGNLIISMIILVVVRFKVHRPIGIYYLVFYITFLVVAILTETGVLLKGWSPRT